MLARLRSAAGYLTASALCLVFLYMVGTDILPSQLIRSCLRAGIILGLLHAILAVSGLLAKLDRTVRIMLAASLFICLWHTLNTNLYQYATDVNGHINYIHSIADENQLPLPDGWQSQQPPLYYLVAAPFYKAGQMAGMLNPAYAVRFLSIFLYTGFLVISLITLQHFFTHRVWLIMASAIVLFWPDGFTYMGRINNDLGILFMQALILYYLLRWNESADAKYLRWSLITSFVALTIKGSAIISIGAVGIICLIALYSRQAMLWQLARWPVILTCLGGIAVNFGRTYYYRAVYGMRVKWFLNLDLNQIRDSLVDNTPYDYLYFDLGSFIHDPFFYSVPKGSELFWNAFLKMLLLGEWTWQSPLLASTLSALLVLMLAYILYFLVCRLTAANFKPYIPLLVTMACMIAALIGARIQVPWPCQANGRYIFDIIVIFSIFFTKALSACAAEKRPLPLMAGVATVIAFCTLAVVLILREHI